MMRSTRRHAPAIGSRPTRACSLTASMRGGVIARSRLKPIGPGAVKPEPEERMRINTEEAKRYLDPEYINAYSLLHSQGIYEGQRAMTSRKRVVNLTRSAYAGQQRYATITWSGDIVASWETLRRQIPAGLNFCLTGSPYWTLDIGAFFVRGSRTYGSGAAITTRAWTIWATASCMCAGSSMPPFCPCSARTAPIPHGKSGGLASPANVVYDTLVKFLRLRYRLMPYIYSLAGLVTQQDYTMLRALPFDFGDDTNTYDDSRPVYVWSGVSGKPGDHAHVFTRQIAAAGGRGARRARSICPLAATGTISGRDNAMRADKRLSADAALDTMPLYVRAGSIIPIGPNIQFTGDQPDAPIELWVYPGQNGHFTFMKMKATITITNRADLPPFNYSGTTSTRQLIFDEREGKLSGNAVIQDVSGGPRRGKSVRSVSSTNHRRANRSL